MEGEERRYISYLLRLWQIKSGGELVWRMSLENPHTHERQGFASLEALFDFLEREIGCSAQGRLSLPDTKKPEGKDDLTQSRL